MKKYILQDALFNIGSQCNLNCNGCYTLSNYQLNGYHRWADFKDTYKQWSEKIDITKWTIYGGEPTLNPTLPDWLAGLSRLWPDSRGQITTNGSTLTDSSKSKQLYEFIVNSTTPIEVHISLHDIDRLSIMTNKVKSWLSDIEFTGRTDLATITESQENWIRTYNNIRGALWPDCPSWDDFGSLPEEIQNECKEVFNFSKEIFEDTISGYKFVDKNGVTVILNKIHWHTKGPLLPQSDNKTFKLHSSDPIKAHSVCDNKLCMEFYEGKLHKCNTAGHFIEFDKQFYIDLTDDERQTMYNYQPGSGDWSVEEISTFIRLSKEHIPQCRFCTEIPEQNEIHASTKKIIFQKKIEI